MQENDSDSVQISGVPSHNLEVATIDISFEVCHSLTQSNSQSVAVSGR